ncbi:MAG: PRC-barrel domain-containing protein [Candidatus Hydrothermarchaeales archaeon]
MITKLGKVFGKEVYTVSGARAGRVTDVAIDVDTRRVSDIFVSRLDPAFQQKYELEGKKGIILSYSAVKAVQDIVLVSDMKPRVKESEAEIPTAEEHTGVIEE